METGEKAASSARGEQLAAVAVTCYGLTSSEQRGGRRTRGPEGRKSQRLLQRGTVATDPGAGYSTLNMRVR